MNKYSCIGALLFIFKFSTGQPITFERTYGSSSQNSAWSVKQMSDSGFVICGKNNEIIDPYFQVLLIRTNKFGDTLLKKNLCGLIGQSLDITTDEGFIITGKASGCSPNVVSDMILIRTDSIGDTLWTKTFGNSGIDEGYSVQQTIDAGFILCGWTSNYSNVIKTDSAGDTLWTRYIPVDALFSIKQTYDSGYVVAGWTGIFLDPYYIARLDTAGNIQWYKTFYDSNFSSFMDVIQMPDSGFIASGEGNRLYRVNAQGDSVWSSMPGQGGYVIDNTSDGGYIVAGISPGVRLTKWDSNNNLQWVKSHYPVPNYFHYTNSIQQTSDGGYVVC